MTFSTINLSGDRVLVKGTDNYGGSGQEVLDASQWLEIQAHDQYVTSKDAFDEAVAEFFLPLTEAAERLKADVKKPEDPASFIVFDEGEEATAGRAKHMVKLNRDSIILRLIETSDTGRLLWVGDHLEVTEYVAPKPAVDDSMAEATALVESVLGGTEVPEPEPGTEG